MRRPRDAAQPARARRGAARAPIRAARLALPACHCSNASTTGSRGGARPPAKLNWLQLGTSATLAAVRVDDDAVFDAVHALPLRLHAAGYIDGLRVDHVDGLADPRAYGRRLHQLAAQRDARPYIVVEKILAPGETLRADWAVEGTTGYDFMNDVGALLLIRPAPRCSPQGYVSGSSRTFAQEALDGKQRVLMRQLAVEHARAAQARVAPVRATLRLESRFDAYWGTRGAVPVYRMYPVQDETRRRRPSRARLQATGGRGRRSCRPVRTRSRRHLAGLPVVRVPRADATALHAARVAFAQLTAPLAAKECRGYGSLSLRPAPVAQ